MENKILAVVAGNEITDKDIDEIITRYPAESRGYFDATEGRNQLLEQSIGLELLHEFSKEINLSETEEFKEALKNFSKEYLTQMAMNKVLAEVTITDEDAQKYYSENKESFVEQPTVSAKHILVDALEKAQNIKNEIGSNEITFEEAALKYSTCPSKEQGGDLGSFGRGMMVPEFEDAAFASEIGIVTEPVKTQFGYHLILVESKNEANEKTFEEVKDAVMQQLTQQAQYNKYQEFIKELEQKYGVDRK